MFLFLVVFSWICNYTNFCLQCHIHVMHTYICSINCETNTFSLSPTPAGMLFVEPFWYIFLHLISCTVDATVWTYLVNNILNDLYQFYKLFDTEICFQGSEYREKLHAIDFLECSYFPREPQPTEDFSFHLNLVHSSLVTQSNQ